MRRAWLLVLAVGCDAGEPRFVPRPKQAREIDPMMEAEPLPPRRSAPPLDGADWTISQRYLGTTDDLLFAYDLANQKLVTFEIATGKTRARAIRHAPAGEPTAVLATPEGFVFTWDRTAVYARATRDALTVAWTGPTGVAPAHVIDDVVIGLSDDKVQALALADGSPRWQWPRSAGARTVADATTFAVTRDAGYPEFYVDYLDPRTGEQRSSLKVPEVGGMLCDLGLEGVALTDYGGAGVVDRAGKMTWTVGPVLGPPDMPFVVGPDAYYVHFAGSERDPTATIFAATLAGKRTWTTTIAAGSDRRPHLAASSTLVFVATGKKVTALDRATGVPTWEHVFAIEPTAMFASHDTLVVVDAYTIIGFPFASRSQTPQRR